MVGETLGDVVFPGDRVPLRIRLAPIGTTSCIRCRVCGHFYPRSRSCFIEESFTDWLQSASAPALHRLFKSGATHRRLRDTQLPTELNFSMHFGPDLAGLGTRSKRDFDRGRSDQKASFPPTSIHSNDRSYSMERSDQRKGAFPHSTDFCTRFACETPPCRHR